MLNSSIYSAMPIIATRDPATIKNSEVFTDVIDMSLYLSVVAVLAIGDVADEGIVFRVVGCDSDGNNPTANVKAITIVHHATTNDGSQHVIELTGAEIAASVTSRYVKFGVVTDNTSGGPMSVTVHGHPTRYHAADLASVANVA